METPTPGNVAAPVTVPTGPPSAPSGATAKLMVAALPSVAGHRTAVVHITVAVHRTEAEHRTGAEVIHLLAVESATEGMLGATANARRPIRSLEGQPPRQRHQDRALLVPMVLMEAEELTELQEVEEEEVAVVAAKGCVGDRVTAPPGPRYAARGATVRQLTSRMEIQLLASAPAQLTVQTGHQPALHLATASQQVDQVQLVKVQQGQVQPDKVHQDQLQPDKDNPDQLQPVKVKLDQEDVESQPVEEVEGMAEEEADIVA